MQVQKKNLPAFSRSTKSQIRERATTEVKGVLHPVSRALFVVLWLHEGEALEFSTYKIAR
jgi:hypothetical protein